MNAGLALFLLSVAPRAADLTVQPGDDLHTLTASLQAGDRVLFSHGTYPLADTLTISGQGTEGAPIVLEANGDAVPILELSAGGWIFQVRDSAHVIVRGLTLQGASDWESNGPMQR